jgi:hypothetical protein
MGAIKPEAAIQVCWELTPKNETREVQGLAEAMKTLGIRDGLILTYGGEGERTVNGMRVPILPVWKWLLKI